MSEPQDDEVTALEWLLSLAEYTLDYDDPAQCNAALLHVPTLTTDSGKPRTPDDDAQRSNTSCAVLSPMEIPGRDHEHDHNRRRRNREAVARHRQQQRQRLALLKIQEAQLQHIFVRTLTHHKHIDNGATPTKPLLRYQAKFTELVRSREALRLENQDLMSRMAVHNQRALALKSISKQRFCKSMGALPHTAGVVWLRCETGQDPLYYEPVSEELCRKMVALRLRKMTDLLQSLAGPGEESTPNLLAWHSERSFTFNERGDPVMLFRFSRHIAKSQTSLTIDEMLERSWKRSTTPEVVGRCPGYPAHRVFVQQVHDDMIIMFRDSPEITTTRRARYLALYHKISTASEDGDVPQRERSAMMATVLMNHTPWENTDEPSPTRCSSRSWLKDGCVVLRISEKPTPQSKRVDVEYMGYVEILDRQHGEHMWAILSLFMLRWE